MAHSMLQIEKLVSEETEGIEGEPFGGGNVTEI